MARRPRRIVVGSSPPPPIEIRSNQDACVFAGRASPGRVLVARLSTCEDRHMARQKNSSEPENGSSRARGGSHENDGILGSSTVSDDGRFDRVFRPGTLDEF